MSEDEDEYEQEALSDYDQHYCECSPSYYCEEFYCELKEFGYKCPNKEVDRK